MTVTRGYEALVILKSAGTEQEMIRQASQVEELIKKTGGRVESAQAMGRRRLAFRIARQQEGHYHLFRFHAPTERIAELERACRLHEAIVRFMIVNADEIPARLPAGQAGAPAAAAPSARS